MVKNQYVVINSYPGEMAPMVQDELDKMGIKSPVLIPADEEIFQFDLEGKPLMGLPDTSVAVQAVGRMIEEITSK